MTTSISTITGAAGPAAAPADPDEALSMRLRDLALVELDALTAGVEGAARAALIAAFADDVADALGEARARMATLRGQLAGGGPLAVLDASPRQRASDAATASIPRNRERLLHQAIAARAYARLGELVSGLLPRLFEADRQR